jgi:hypothetical protein
MPQDFNLSLEVFFVAHESSHDAVSLTFLCKYANLSRKFPFFFVSCARGFFMTVVAAVVVLLVSFAFE